MSPGVVGRERELASLRDFASRIPTGAVSLVLEGEAGVGKTTLWGQMAGLGPPEKEEGDDPQDHTRQRRGRRRSGLAVPALGDSWGADRSQASVRVSPDLADRAAAAKQKELFAVLDARERSFAASRVAATAGTPEPAHDDHFRFDPSSVPTPVAKSDPGGGFDWSQLGIGFAVGVLLMLGLMVAMRMPRARQPAH
jgi:hypothetical protein